MPFYSTTHLHGGEGEMCPAKTAGTYRSSARFFSSEQSPPDHARTTNPAELAPALAFESRHFLEKHNRRKLPLSALCFAVFVGQSSKLFRAKSK